MTDEQLAAIAARAEAATLGRWIADQDIGVRLADYTPICWAWNEHSDSPNALVNMRFIAHARDDVPALLAEVADLRAQLAAVPVAAIAALYDAYAHAAAGADNAAEFSAVGRWLGVLPAEE